jgi:hypothetical protein
MDYWKKRSALAFRQQPPEKPDGILEVDGEFIFTRQLIEENEAAANFVDRFRNVLRYDMCTETWRF